MYLQHVVFPDDVRFTIVTALSVKLACEGCTKDKLFGILQRLGSRRLGDLELGNLHAW